MIMRYMSMHVNFKSGTLQHILYRSNWINPGFNFKNMSFETKLAINDITYRNSVKLHYENGYVLIDEGFRLIVESFNDDEMS